MKPMGHQAILASAGSGKTFQLAHRYIRLLAEGVAPDRIVAMTFSRKAAAEIFDTIVARLGAAAESGAEARAIAGRIGRGEMRPAAFLKQLRELLDHLPRLRIGTLDSFTVGVVRNFPMELGIPLHFEIADNDGPAARQARQDALDRIFSARLAPRRDQQAFLEAFRLSTFGQEDKGIEETLHKYIGDYQRCYQLLPDARAWGNPKTIWGDDPPWRAVALVEDAADRMGALIEAAEWSEKIKTRWRTFIEAARQFDPVAGWDSVKYLFAKLAPELADRPDGPLELKVDRSAIVLTGEMVRLSRILVWHLVRVAVEMGLKQTQGLYGILHLFERVYDEHVRKRGFLTFDDVLSLLHGSTAGPGGLSLRPGAGDPGRLSMEYRLDGRLDHWLLDEFQDTSDLQWSVFQNLADEVIQDDSGERSFFFVGDVKQAIYGWRGGNARLFQTILARYGKRIRREPLTVSYRSCRPIIDTVNKVFGRLPDDPIPAGALTAWREGWIDHDCAPTVPKRGYAALLEPEYHPDGDKPDEEDRFQLVASLLEEINPVRRQLSTAILVRTNLVGQRLVNYLRRACRGLSILHEGHAPVADNPVVALLVSLVRLAVHPGDRLAWRHLQMSPLGGTLPGGADHLAVQLLRTLHESGFEALLRPWAARLEEAGALDAFGKSRLEAVLELARQFDREGNRNGDEFVNEVTSRSIREPGLEDAVRVMTYHQAKGLGFDLVILPELHRPHEKLSGGDSADFLMPRNRAGGDPAWALRLPRRDLAVMDDTLRARLLEWDEEQDFDLLCLLYVALTRARQGLYMVTSFPGPTAESFTTASLLKQCLCGQPKPAEGQPVVLGGRTYSCLYQAGEPDWYRHTPVQPCTRPPADAARMSRRFTARRSRRRRLLRVSPSRQAESPRPASTLFAPPVSASLQVGTAVHELFERVGWLDETDVEAVAADWASATGYPAALRDDAADRFRAACRSPEIRNLLTRPSGEVILWREKRFDMVQGSEWITGMFDRVALWKIPAGGYDRAEVFDFKTNEIRDEAHLTATAEQYRPQLQIYGRALARMLGLGSGRISLKLVFTQPGRVVDVPGEG
jgi:ATP-dependent helicase/nuclease subunit A